MPFLILIAIIALALAAGAFLQVSKGRVTAGVISGIAAVTLVVAAALYAVEWGVI